MTFLGGAAAFAVTWFVVNATHAAVQLLLAQRFGVDVDRVSLGVGPTLWSRAVGPTTFRVALLPVALVVRLRKPWRAGAEGIWPATAPGDLRAKSRWVRLAIFGAPPLALLALCWVAAFWMFGYPLDVADARAIVGAVGKETPAAAAGLRDGDRILAIDGQPISTFEELRSVVLSSGGRELEFEYLRAHALMRTRVAPQPLARGVRYLIGVQPRIEAEAPPAALERTARAFQWIGAGFRSMRLATRSDRETVAGPIAVYSLASRGFGEILARWASLSILQYFLACLLLPFLDGPRLLFLGLEALARRPLHPRFETRFNLAWLALFAFLWLAALLRDFARLLG